MNNTPLNFHPNTNQWLIGSQPSVEDWRGQGGDFTDTGTLLNAIAAAKLAGGMRLSVPALTYTINQTLLIDESNIFLDGQGAGWWLSGTANLQTSPRTKFLWGGAAGGTIVKFTSSGQAQARYGGGMRGIQLDGNNFSAAVGLHLASWCKGFFEDVISFACSDTQFLTSVVEGETIGSHSGVQRNEFRTCIATTLGGGGDYLTSTANGWRLMGISAAAPNLNTSLNTFISCAANMSKGIAWKLEDCDDNFFYFVTGSATRDSTVHGLELGSKDQSSVVGGTCARHNFFYGCGFGLAGVHARAGQTGGVSSFANILVGLTRANNGPRPVVETGAGGSANATAFFNDTFGNQRSLNMGLVEASVAPPTVSDLSSLYIDAVAGPLQLKDSTGAVRQILDSTLLLAGAWTPVFSFQTPGDSVISHTTQIGKYLKLGNFVLVMMDIAFDTNAYTTAAGVAQIAGLPFAAAVVDGSLSVGTLSNATFTTAQDLRLSIPTGGSVMFTKIVTSNAAAANAGMGVFPASKTGIRIKATGMYWTNA